MRSIAVVSGFAAFAAAAMTACAELSKDGSAERSVTMFVAFTGRPTAADTSRG